MTESENMRQRRWYDAQFDEKLLKQRLFAEDLCFDLNHTRPTDQARREAILKKFASFRRK